MVWTCLPFIRSDQNHLAGHSERGKRQDRRRKGWEDNTREWTDLELAKSLRAVENRGKWRKLVVKSSVVHQTTLAIKGQMTNNNDRNRGSKGKSN